MSLVSMDQNNIVFCMFRQILFDRKSLIYIKIDRGEKNIFLCRGIASEWELLGMMSNVRHYSASVTRI